MPQVLFDSAGDTISVEMRVSHNRNAIQGAWRNSNSLSVRDLFSYQCSRLHFVTLIMVDARHARQLRQADELIHRPLGAQPHPVLHQMVVCTLSSDISFRNITDSRNGISLNNIGVTFDAKNKDDRVGNAEDCVRGVGQQTS